MDKKTLISLLKYLHRHKPSPEVRIYIDHNPYETSYHVSEIWDGHPGAIAYALSNCTTFVEPITFGIRLLTGTEFLENNQYYEYQNAFGFKYARSK